MNSISRLGVVMAGILVGLGVAVFAKAVATVGFDRLVLGHIVGPGLMCVGIMRIKLQRMVAAPRDDHGDGREPEGGTDGRTP